MSLVDSALTSNDLCAAAGITYRQLDYWTRNGVPLGSNNGRGSGSRRCFTSTDVAVARFLSACARVLPDGRWARTSLCDGIARVAAEVYADTSVLDRPLVFIGQDYTISATPVPGWVVAP